MNPLDRFTGWIADRYNFALAKFRVPDKAPPYIGAELGELGVSREIWGEWSHEQKARAAATISWIYSNIFRISNEVSAAEFTVVKRQKNYSEIDHPLETLMMYPNEFFDGQSLLRYTIWGLYLGEYGAFWYLAPDKKTGEIKEIWPIPIDRLTPVKHPTKFISHYEYKSKKSGDVIRIRPEYIVRFFFSHPWDLWKNFGPLEAATMAMSVYTGLATNQRDLFVKGRGVPLAVLSVDSSISDTEFAVVRQRLREDWEDERKVAITRAGSLDVASVGISNRDLEVVASQNFNRDELDAVFMGGIPWRSDQFKSGEGLREANKQVKESVIHPLHKMIASQIYLGIIARFYDPDLIGSFSDVRAQDRSILLQERNVYWRAQTLNEARADLGKSPFVGIKDDASMNGIQAIPDWFGELPLTLATNAPFVMSLLGIGTQPPPDGFDVPGGKGGTGNGQIAENETGNLPGMLDEERVVQDESKSINFISALTEASRQELLRYRKILLKMWREYPSAKALVDRKFDTDIVFGTILDDIRMELLNVSSEEDIKAIFEKWLSS